MPEIVNHFGIDTTLMRLGQRVWLSKQPNRAVTRITRILSRSSLEIETYIRPSRGFARHVRRAKTHGK